MAVSMNPERLARDQQNARDLAIINRRATRLNREAKDVLDYQNPS